MSDVRPSFSIYGNQEVLFRWEVTPENWQQVRDETYEEAQARLASSSSSGGCARGRGSSCLGGLLWEVVIIMMPRRSFHGSPGGLGGSTSILVIYHGSRVLLLQQMRQTLQRKPQFYQEVAEGMEKATFAEEEVKLADEAS